MLSEESRDHKDEHWQKKTIARRGSSGRSSLRKTLFNGASPTGVDAQGKIDPKVTRS